MGNWAIKVEGLSKKYRLSHKKANSDDTLLRAFAGGLINMFSSGGQRQLEDFWALRDVDFTIHPGDRVGIIGRNGAGKSTLLKILSRVVKPTSGRIEYNGRMASLLEVGTGFHGELTGRENIYLNGTILGMSRSEIDRKFDEIVAFSEIEQFLDTPVKRYSSGMYVRLAFSVAAHLNNDILIVDEVLAVGDAAFQEKCIGKINASQSQGKTVLFVSHNIGQIAALCTRGIFLEQGTVKYDGTVDQAVSLYLKKNENQNRSAFEFAENASEYAVRSIRLENAHTQATNVFKHDETYHIRVAVNCRRKINDVLLGISINDASGKRVVSMNLPISDKLESGQERVFTAKIPGNHLTPNEYLVSVALHIPNLQLFDEHLNLMSYTIVDNGSEFYKYGGEVGYVFPFNEWIF